MDSEILSRSNVCCVHGVPSRSSRSASFTGSVLPRDFLSKAFRCSAQCSVHGRFLFICSTVLFDLLLFRSVQGSFCFIWFDLEVVVGVEELELRLRRADYSRLEP